MSSSFGGKRQFPGPVMTVAFRDLRTEEYSEKGCEGRYQGLAGAEPLPGEEEVTFDATDVVKNIELRRNCPPFGAHREALRRGRHDPDDFSGPLVTPASAYQRCSTSRYNIHP